MVYSSSTSWMDVEARAVRGRPLPETPFGIYAVELVVAYRLWRTGRQRLAARSRRKYTTKSLRRSQELEKWLYQLLATKHTPI